MVESPTHRYAKGLARQVLERYGFAVITEFWVKRVTLSPSYRLDVVGFCVEKEVCGDHVVVVEVERNRWCEGGDVLARVAEAVRLLDATLVTVVARVPKCYSYVRSYLQGLTGSRHTKVYIVESPWNLEGVLKREVAGVVSSGRVEQMERRVGDVRILAYDRDSNGVVEDVAVVGSRGFVVVSIFSRAQEVEVRVVASAQSGGARNTYLRKVYKRWEPQLQELLTLLSIERLWSVSNVRAYVQNIVRVLGKPQVLKDVTSRVL